MENNNYDEQDINIWLGVLIRLIKNNSKIIIVYSFSIFLVLITYSLTDYLMKLNKNKLTKYDVELSISNNRNLNKKFNLEQERIWDKFRKKHQEDSISKNCSISGDYRSIYSFATNEDFIDNFAKKLSTKNIVKKKTFLKNFKVSYSKRNEVILSYKNKSEEKILEVIDLYINELNKNLKEKTIICNGIREEYFINYLNKLNNNPAISSKQKNYLNSIYINNMLQNELPPFVSKTSNTSKNKVKTVFKLPPFRILISLFLSFSSIPIIYKLLLIKIKRTITSLYSLRGLISLKEVSKLYNNQKDLNNVIIFNRLKDLISREKSHSIAILVINNKFNSLINSYISKKYKNLSFEIIKFDELVENKFDIIFFAIIPFEYSEIEIVKLSAYRDLYGEKVAGWIYLDEI